MTSRLSCGDRARSRLAAKRGGGARPSALDEYELVAEENLEAIAELDDALQRLGTVKPRHMQLLQHRYFGGLTLEESAVATGVSLATAKRDAHLASIDAVLLSGYARRARLLGALGDPYRIEHEIGAGGMATVYLARDLKHDRDVALKVLRPELAAVLGVNRFLNEIRISARFEAQDRCGFFTTKPGGPVRKLGAFPVGDGFSVSKDGRRIVAHIYSAKHDVHMIRNFGTLLRR